MPRQWQRLWFAQARRFIAGVVLVAYVLVGLGIPVPQVVAARNAEPPATPLASSCCSGGAGGCCCSVKGSAGKSCCGVSTDRSCCATPAASEPSSDDGTTHLRLVPLTCPCSATLWVSTGSVLPAIPTPTWAPHLAASEWVSHVDVVGPSLQVIPPDPPPRVQA